MVQIGNVRIPLFALLSAVPRAVRAASKAASDDRAGDSPGGAKVTAGEVSEVVFVFVSALAEEALPSILKANGVSP